MSKITSSSVDYQTFPTLFELEPVAGKKVTVDSQHRDAATRQSTASLRPSLKKLRNPALSDPLLFFFSALQTTFAEKSVWLRGNPRDSGPDIGK